MVSSLSLFGIFFSYPYVFVDAHSQPLPVERNQRRTTRSRAASRILATLHQPNALRLTASNASAPCPRSRPPPPYASLCHQRRQTLTVGTANLAGKGGASPARGRRTMRQTAVERQGSAASERRRPRSTPAAKRQPRAGEARRQRGGGGAHEAQSGKSAPPAREQRRRAWGAQWQPRASKAARHVDGRRR